MGVKIYRTAVSLMWFLAAFVLASVGYFLYSSDKVSINFNSSNGLLGIYVAAVLLCVFIAICAYLQKVFSLLVLVPFTLISIGFLYQYSTADQIIYKYIYMSVFMVALNLVTVHLVIQPKGGAYKNA